MEEFTPEDYSAIFENMCYSDYLSAVYSYDEKALTKAKAEKKLANAAIDKNKKNQALKQLLSQKSKNQDERIKLVQKANALIKNNKKEAEERIIHAKEKVTQAAEEEISSRQEDFNKRIEDFNSRAEFLKKEQERLSKELEKIAKSKEAFSNYTGKKLPVANNEVLQMLLHAKKKRWLTEYHKDLIASSVKQICGKRISDFNDLMKEERSFAKSKMVSDIKRGKVTKQVIYEFAKRTSIITAVVFGLICLAAIVLPTVSFLAGLQALVSYLFCGGFFMNVVCMLKKQYYPQLKAFWVTEVTMCVSFILGILSGYLIWDLLVSEKNNFFTLAYAVFSAVGTGFLIRRLLISHPAKKILCRLPFLKDRARYYIFKNSTELEDGKYNLQIYCYFCHDAIMDYLSIEYKNKTVARLQNDEELCLNLKEKYEREQIEMEAKKRELDQESERINTFIESRRKQLSQQLEDINSGKAFDEIPDLTDKFSPEFEQSMEQLKAESESLDAQIEKAQLASDKADQYYETVRSQYGKAAYEFEKLTAGLRYWNKTPVPSSTGFKLTDAICFESNRQQSIFHHNLQPFAFRYSVLQEESNPALILKSTIYRYIKALMKINPARMIQINIIDPVSDPSILLNSQQFFKFSPLGIINGVSTMSDFEIRLFNNERNYETFKTVFRKQCRQIVDFLRDNQEIGDNSCSIELANKIKNDDRNPFMYQVMMFIVPRATDETTFEPPSAFVRSLKNGTYAPMGILPVFFVDKNSIHEKWREVVDLCKSGCVVTQRSSE